MGRSQRRVAPPIKWIFSLLLAGDSEHTVWFENDENIFEHTITVYGNPPGAATGGKDPVLKPGQHVFSFAFPIPADRPIFPQPFSGACGQIRYLVKAVMDRPGIFTNKQKTAKEFKMPYTQYDLNLDPRSREPAVCCMCCQGGLIEASLRVPKIEYVHGEVIPMRGDVVIVRRMWRR